MDPIFFRRVFDVDACFAVLRSTVCLSSLLYEYAKENAGPLKPGVDTVEQTVKAVVGPVSRRLQRDRVDTAHQSVLLERVSVIHFNSIPAGGEIVLGFGPWVLDLGLDVMGSPGSGRQRAKRPNSFADFLVQFRWVLIVPIVLPLSFLFYQYIQGRATIRRGSHRRRSTGGRSRKCRIASRADGLSTMG